MAKMTPQGKIFSVDELINFGRINSYGAYNNAVLMALYDLKRLQIENNALKEELDSYEVIEEDEINKTDPS